MDNTFDITSATGVDLQLNIAGPGARSYAFVIDWHIRVLLALVWWGAMHIAVVGAMEFLDSSSAKFSLYIYTAIVPAVGIYFLYHPVLEILMRGRTPGKRMAGVRIVTHEAQEPGVLAHIVRNLLRMLDSLPVAYVVGLTAAFTTKNSVRIGDMAAGTVLIYDSDARGDNLSSVPVSPSAVRQHGLTRAELGQDLLHRWAQLQPAKCRQLAVQLLASLDPELRPEDDLKSLRQQLVQTLGAGGKDQ